MDNIIHEKCRLLEGLPFSGVTLVADYMAHYHKDTTNAKNVISSVVNLVHPVFRNTSPQAHILPQNGVAFELGHGDVLLECAKEELHGTTRPPVLPKDDQSFARVALVFICHRELHRPDHGREKNKKYQESRKLKQLLKEKDAPKPKKRRKK